MGRGCKERRGVQARNARNKYLTLDNPNEYQLSGIVNALDVGPENPALVMANISAHIDLARLAIGEQREHWLSGAEERTRRFTDKRDSMANTDNQHYYLRARLQGLFLPIMRRRMVEEKAVSPDDTQAVRSGLLELMQVSISPEFSTGDRTDKVRRVIIGHAMQLREISGEAPQQFAWPANNRESVRFGDSQRWTWDMSVSYDGFYSPQDLQVRFTTDRHYRAHSSQGVSLVSLHELQTPDDRLYVETALMERDMKAGVLHPEGLPIVTDWLDRRSALLAEALA